MLTSNEKRKRLDKLALIASLAATTWAGSVQDREQLFQEQVHIHHRGVRVDANKVQRPAGYKKEFLVVNRRPWARDKNAISLSWLSGWAELKLIEAILKFNTVAPFGDLGEVIQVKVRIKWKNNVDFWVRRVNISILVKNIRASSWVKICVKGICEFFVNLVIKVLIGSQTVKFGLCCWVE